MGKFYIFTSQLSWESPNLFLFQEETLYIKKQQSLRSLIQLAKKIYSQNPVRSSKEEDCNPSEEMEPSYVSMVFDESTTKKKKESEFPQSEIVKVSLSEDYVEMCWVIKGAVITNVHSLFLFRALAYIWYISPDGVPSH